MENYHYYILKNGISSNKQGLGKGEFIVRTNQSFSETFEEGEGPYNSLVELKTCSLIYASLKKTNIKRAQKIIREENIFKSETQIQTSNQIEFDKYTIDAFIHSTIGRIKNGDLTGIHFFDESKMKILEIIEKNTNSNVFKAKFEFYDSRTKKWIVKKKPSTFFPLDWSISKLLLECKYAIEKLKTQELKDGNFRSITESKIEVEIIVRNGSLKSLYPVL